MIARNAISDRLHSYTHIRCIARRTWECLQSSPFHRSIKSFTTGNAFFSSSNSFCLRFGSLVLVIIIRRNFLPTLQSTYRSTRRLLSHNFAHSIANNYPSILRRDTLGAGTRLTKQNTMKATDIGTKRQTIYMCDNIRQRDITL